MIINQGGQTLASPPRTHSEPISRPGLSPTRLTLVNQHEDLGLEPGPFNPTLAQEGHRLEGPEPSPVALKASLVREGSCEDSRSSPDGNSSEIKAQEG